MSPTGPTPQFGTAEYASTGETCKSCKQAISRGNYYRINGMVACENCVRQVQQHMPKDSHTAYVRGILFGIGAAILGFALFAGFVIITGISLGYVSLAVGYLIGKGMNMGSGGIGGRRYQVVAAALTYTAVSLAAIPIEIHFSHAVQSRSASDWVLVGLASPFRDLQSPINGILGLIILAVGINIAWKMTAGPKLEITGPFEDKSVAALPTPLG